jgi:hypothetical protein
MTPHLRRHSKTGRAAHVVFDGFSNPRPSNSCAFGVYGVDLNGWSFYHLKSRLAASTASGLPVYCRISNIAASDPGLFAKRGGRRMSDYLIVVVNRVLSRFFTLEPVEFPELESGPRMCPCEEMTNPEIADSQELYTDSKTGRGAAPQGGAIHGYEDNRDQHLDEVRRRFAASVIERMHKLARSKKARTIILISSTRMRQFLYPDLETMARDDFQIIKISKNMINFTSNKIHAYLAEEGFVPAQRRMS